MLLLEGRLEFRVRSHFLTTLAFQYTGSTSRRLHGVTRWASGGTATLGEKPSKVASEVSFDSEILSGAIGTEWEVLE